MHAFVRLFAAGVCAAAAASAVHAQVRHLSPGPANTVPSTSTRAAQAAPKPGGLMPVFPAGISSGSGASVSTDPVAASTSPIPPSGVLTTPIGIAGAVPPAELPSVDAFTGAVTNVPATNVLGAGATVPGPSQRVAAGAGGFAATDVARSFFFADANHDGELTRAEARRLSIGTMSFEEMDRNFDGVVSRFEYEDSVR